MHYWSRTLPCEGAWGNLINPYNFMGVLSAALCPRTFTELRSQGARAFPSSGSLQREQLALMGSCALWDQISAAQCQCGAAGRKLRLLVQEEQGSHAVVRGFEVDEHLKSTAYAFKTPCGKRSTATAVVATTHKTCVLLLHSHSSNGTQALLTHSGLLVSEQCKLATLCRTRQRHVLQALLSHSLALFFMAQDVAL